MSINGEIHTVKLIDTAGQEEYERVRKLFYKESDCFILCYDISNRTSFTNILQKWLPELKSIDRWPIPIILVGKIFSLLQVKVNTKAVKYFIFSSPATKTDLRQNSRKPLVSTEEGEELCRKIHANRFIECSAKENIQIVNAIHEAVRATIKGPIVVKEERLKRRAIICPCCQS